jgi:hypothetical protein
MFQKFPFFQPFKVTFSIDSVSLIIDFSLFPSISDPTVQHPTARSSSRIFVAQLLVRLTLTIAFPLMQSTPSLRWVLVLLYVLGCGSVAFLYTWYLPVRSLFDVSYY